MLLDLCHGNSLQGILELLDAGTLVLLGGASRALYDRCDDSQLWPMLFAVQWGNLTSYRPNRLDYLRRSRQERQELERQEQAAQPYLAEWGVEPDPVPFIDLTRDDAVQVYHSLSPHCLLLFVPCRMNLQRSGAGWRRWDQKWHGELSLLQPPIGAVTYWTRNQVDGLPDVATSPAEMPLSTLCCSLTGAWLLPEGSSMTTISNYVFHPDRPATGLAKLVGGPHSCTYVLD